MSPAQKQAGDTLFVIRNYIEGRQNDDAKQKPRQKAELKNQNIAPNTVCASDTFVNCIKHREISVAGKIKNSL